MSRGWWKIVCATVVVTALYTAYALYKPSLYSAQLTVLVPSRYSPDRLLANALGMPPELEIGSARIEAVLRSDELTDAVIEHFGLTARYGFANRDQGREKLRELCQVTQEPERRLVFLTCNTDDPALSKSIVDFMGTQGSQVYRHISQSVATQERVFLDSRVERARKDLADARDNLHAFQREHHVIDIDAQAKLITAAIGKLEGEKIRKHIELAYMRSFASATEATSQQLEHQLAVTERQIRDLEETQTGSDSILVPATAVPELDLEFHALARDAVVREAVFENLLQRQELARVAEGRDTATFDLLEPASLPTRSDWPRRSVIIGGGVFAGVMLGFAWLLLPGWWRRQQWYSP
jgi:uncharacterized protein involved in exopolysaccharide biosynthesis